MDDGTDLRLPPHDRMAEEAVLGAMLRDNAVIGDVLQIVRREHFYHAHHQDFFESIAGVVDRGRPADLVTVADELKARGKIEAVGGYAALASLWDAVPTAANAEHYARIVRGHAVVRALIHASTETMRDAYDRAASPDEQLDAAERRIFCIAANGVMGTTVPIATALNEAAIRIDARIELAKSGTEAMSGLKTGLFDLDSLTSGLQCGELILLAARPSVGKTGLAGCIARHVCVEQGMAVLFLSLEQSRAELAERLLCCQAQISSKTLRNGRLSHAQVASLQDARDTLSKSLMFVDDTPGQTISRIAGNARRLRLRHGIALLVIDYLQLIEVESRRENREQQVSGISRRLKNLARELNVPVLCLCQLNRQLENRPDKTPRLSDLRESGSLEQDADSVYLMHRDGEVNSDAEREVIEVIVAKQRNGPVGRRQLLFHKSQFRFDNYAPPPDELR